MGGPPAQSALVDLDPVPIDLGPVLIDLDPLVGKQSGPLAGVRRMRPGARVLSALVIVVGVAALLTGPTGLPALRLAWQIDLSSPYAWLDPAAVYTVDRSGGDRVALAARDPRTGRVRWQVPLTGALATAYADPLAQLVTRFPPFLRDPVVTEAIWPDTRPRVSFPAYAMPLAYVGAEVAVVIDRDAADDPVAEPAGGAADSPHQVTALDLRTGAVRWTRQLPAGTRWALPGVRPGTAGLVGLPAGSQWLVTDTPAGMVEVWDLNTGAVRARRAFPELATTSYLQPASYLQPSSDPEPVPGTGSEPPKQPWWDLGSESYVMALTDAVLLRVRDQNGARVQVLDPATLSERSRFVPVLPDAEPLRCAPAICLTANGGVAVVEPTTGDQILLTTATMVRPGPAGRMLLGGYDKPLSIVDLQDGTLRRLPGWLLVDSSSYGDQAVIATGVDQVGHGELGLLDVGTGAIWRLGHADGWWGSLCQADARVLVCVSGTAVRVWQR